MLRTVLFGVIFGWVGLMFSVQILASNLSEDHLDSQAIFSYIRKYHRLVPSKDARVISESLVSQSYTHHVDPKLMAALIAVESGFKKDAVSRCGAKGLGQLMDGTYRRFSIKNPFDIHENISATYQYMKKLVTMWEGEASQLTLVLASYLKGETFVKKQKNQLSPVTIRYTQLILKCYQDLCTMRTQHSREVATILAAQEKNANGIDNTQENSN